MMIGGSSAASSICSSAAHAGAIARPSMVPIRQSIIASIAGPKAGAGVPSSKHWPIAASTAWLCRSTPPRSRRIAPPAAEKGGARTGDRPVARWTHTTKVHALSDPDCRPCAFHLTPGQDADIAAAPALLALAPPMSSLIADKGYDGDGFRADIVNRGAKAVIPNKSNRVTLHRFNKRAYRGRNVIERCFCRLKDFRRMPPAMISLLGTSSPLSSSPPLWPTGSIESGP
jgi:transposase